MYTSYSHSFTWSSCIKKSTYRYLLAQSRLQQGIHYPHPPLRWQGHFLAEEGWPPLTPPLVWKLWSCVVCQLWSRLWSQAWSQPWSQSLSLLEILCWTWWNNSVVWVLPLVLLALSLKLQDSCWRGRKTEICCKFIPSLVTSKAKSQSKITFYLNQVW